MSFPALDVPREYAGPDGPVSVYALVDPRDGTVRYIGQTADRLRRLSNHVSASVTAGNTEKLGWIAELKRSHRAPLLVELERCQSDDATDVESRWIAHYAALGDIYNVMPRKRQSRRLTPKTGTKNGLTIYVTRADHQSIRRAAAAEMDAPATWARKVILRAVEAARSQLGEEKEAK